MGQASALVLYSEYDEHAWMADQYVVASGSWFPTAEQIKLANWTDPFVWNADFEEYLLLTSAADGKNDLQPDDYVPVSLKQGAYLVEFAFIEAEYVGCFTRLTRKVAASGA